MEIYESVSREIITFLLGPKGVALLLLTALLVYVHKYMAAGFCFASIIYIVGLASIARFFSLDVFPITVFLCFLGAGLILLGCFGYLLFIRAPEERPGQPMEKKVSSIFMEGSNSGFFLNKRDSSLFMHG